MSDLHLKFKTASAFPLRRQVVVRPGVHLYFSSGVMDRGLRWITSTTAPVFELAYSRKHSLYSELGHACVEIKPGYANMGFLGETSGCSEYCLGDEIRMYSIWVEPYIFDDFCEAVGGKRKVGFGTFQNIDRPYYFFQCGAREESLLTRLDKAMETSGDRLNRLLLESQVLELLSMNIERLMRPDREENCSMPLSAADMEGLHDAREILLRRLNCPPSLYELSHLIQMNDFKMKRLFKQYYGKTVYQYIREERMEKAFSLLQEGNHNVSQAAYVVGYINVSHFSEAFKKYFGVSPHKVIPHVSASLSQRRNTD